jgi:hypothetical protein
LSSADAYLSTQPGLAENEKGQLRDIHADGGGNPLKPWEGLAPQIGHLVLRRLTDGGHRNRDDSDRLAVAANTSSS